MTVAPPRASRHERPARARLAALVGLAAFAAGLGCARAEEISVTQYGASLYGVPDTVAMDRGLFKKAGIDISGILGSAAGGTTVRNILASPTP